MSTVLFKLDHIIADRTEYKKYIAQLSGENIYVQVDLDDKEVNRTKDKVVLTTKGLTAVMNIIATEIETMHEAHNKKKYGV